MIPYFNLLEKLPLRHPRELPVLPLRNVVAFPGLALPLFVGREKSIRAVEYGLSNDKLAFLVAQRDLNIENPDPGDLYSFGTVGIIVRSMRLQEKGNKIKILIQGLWKAKMLGIIQTEPFILATLQKELSGELGANDQNTRPLVEEVKKKLNELVFKCRKEYPMDMMLVVDSMIDAGEIAYLVAANLGLEVSQAQEILEIDNPVQKLIRLNIILEEQISLKKPKKYDESMTSKRKSSNKDNR